MKKLTIFALPIMLLVGCTNYDSGEEINDQLVDVGNLGSGYDLVRDTNTGCIYIRETNVSHSKPLTPYYDEEGKVAGCGEENFDKSKYE